VPVSSACVLVPGCRHGLGATLGSNSQGIVRRGAAPPVTPRSAVDQQTWDHSRPMPSKTPVDILSISSARSRTLSSSGCRRSDGCAQFREIRAAIVRPAYRARSRCPFHRR
jgi:hypothetical protein